MPWAVHSAELRLWLQLIIEEDIPFAQRKLHPLLPNLNLRLRSGDSMVQEVGGLNLHIRDKSLSPPLKRKLNALKREKEKYYNNDPTAKFKKPESLLREELRIFTELLDERIRGFQEKLVQLSGGEKRRPQPEMFAEYKKAEKKQKELFEREVKELEAKIRDLQKVRTKIQAPGGKPFVWDIDYAEIFGDKGGFDIVIGNPPYVRQEKIAPPNRLKREITAEEKREYKKKLLKSIQAHFPAVKKIDKKSDYYIYFYFHGLSLLNGKGTFCFITSNSWLDVGYGKDLQEFLLSYCPLKAIYDNQAKRSFAHADVNTVIALFGAPMMKRGGGKDRPALSETARFVMFKEGFDKVINTRNLLEIERADAVLKTGAFRVFPVKQETLLEEGWEYPEEYQVPQSPPLQKGSAPRHTPPLIKGGQGGLLKDKFQTGKYQGNKWGGKCLRAPDIFFAILEKGKGKLVRLGDVAEVRRGITTGCNEFFYLPSKYFDIKKENNYYNLIPKQEDLPKDIKIEEEFLRPLIKSPLECKKLLVNENDTSVKVVICNKTRPDIANRKIAEYIHWGEQVEIKVKQGTNKGGKVKGFCSLETTKNRGLWYSLGERKKADAVWVKSVHDNHGQAVLGFDGYIDQRLYEISFYNDISEDVAMFLLNNSISYLCKELGGRTNLGEGVLDTAVYEAKKMLLLDPAIFNKKNINVKIGRESQSIFDELGINPNLPIREQTPNPLPYRKALDDIVFDILGLTPKERDEVYWAVCELVKDRLDKARSV